MRARNKPFVDKTGAIAELLLQPRLSHRVIFTRPRKFGKSLTLDMMSAILAAGTLPRGVQPWPGYEPVDVEALFGGPRPLAVYERLKDGRPLLHAPHFVVHLSLGTAPSGTLVHDVIRSELALYARRVGGAALEQKVAQKAAL